MISTVPALPLSNFTGTVTTHVIYRLGAHEPRSGCAKGPQGPEPGEQVLGEGLHTSTTKSKTSQAWEVERPSGALLAEPSHPVSGW